MTKTELIKKVAEQTGLTKHDAAAIIHSMLNPQTGIIVSVLKSGEKVTLSGFGTFSTRLRASRQARNPRTGKSVKVPKRKYPAFKPAKGLKEALKK